MSTVEAGHNDVELWLSWKRASEVVRARVLAEVLADSQLTEPELTVLAHLDESAGTMQQNALARAAGWDRTRLSHLLTRMENRGYVSRERLRNGARVILLEPGRDALAGTRQPLARAVERHITSRLDDGLRQALRAIIEALH